MHKSLHIFQVKFGLSSAFVMYLADFSSFGLRHLVLMLQPSFISIPCVDRVRRKEVIITVELYYSCNDSCKQVLP